MVEGKIRVLTVDDSSYARYAISRQLQTDPDIEVIDFARDGAEAVEKVQALRPDVVTLDIEMPRMNGLEALETIMSTCPTPVIMLSTLTGKGTEATIKALGLGALDFFLKTSITKPAGNQEMADELTTKIRMAARARVFKLRTNIERRQLHPGVKGCQMRKLGPPSNVIVIGSSTGGPRALYELIPAIPGDVAAAILVVQHMPPGFTKSLADRLDETSQIEVKEAETNDELRQGQALLAPGGYHMTVTKKRKVDLNQNPPVCGVRPSVDVTMESVAAVFGPSVLGVVLTGMGSDGTRGTSLIKAAGGKVIAEDESTCAIYGMPKSVVEAGNADQVLPLPRVVSELSRMLGS